MIPVPDRVLEATIVEDASDILKMLSKLCRDLVLSLHRHRPWSWKLNDINFLFSGAVLTIRLRGFFENTYNVIKIENEKIKPQLKIVGGDFIDFKKLILKRKQTTKSRSDVYYLEKMFTASVKVSFTSSLDAAPKATMSKHPT